jgi:metal-responsive CopG/Arc/MetJ family transcriptional regulator
MNYKRIAMDKIAKVAISLPEQVLKAVEKERKAKGENRSEFFRRAVEELLKRERESKAVEAYIQGYRASPESVEEIEVAHRAGVSILAEEPW